MNEYKAIDFYYFLQIICGHLTEDQFKRLGCFVFRRHRFESRRQVFGRPRVLADLPLSVQPECDFPVQGSNLKKISDKNGDLNHD